MYPNIPQSTSLLSKLADLKGTIKFTYLPYSYNGTITLVLQDIFGRRKTVEIPCNYNRN